MTGFTLGTYVLQVISDVTPDERTGVIFESESDKRVLADLPAMIEKTEEELEALLPEGYKVRITEWDK